MSRLGMVGLGVVGMLLACDSSGGGGGPSDGTASLRVAQAAQGSGTVAIRVDGDLVASVMSGTSSLVTDVPAGTHSVSFSPAGAGQGSTRQMTFAEGSLTMLVVRDSSGVVIPDVLSDTGMIVPAGKTKVRFIHAAALAPAIDILRTQPDFPTPIRVMFPFAYGAESPYLQSDVGDWSVLVTPENQVDTLYNSPPFAVGDGKRVTVVVMDSSQAGGITAMLIPEN